MSIHAKLLAIQNELKAPKSQYNSFGKYNYRNCEDIFEGLKPLLKAQRCNITISDEIRQIGERYYIEATATLTDVETGECVSTTAYAREEESKKGMDGSQVTGASSSYARKYALNGLFAIDDTKDTDGGDNGKPSESNKSKYICAECGKPFTSCKDKNGKDLTAAQCFVAATNASKDGKARCKECHLKHND